MAKGTSQKEIKKAAEEIAKKIELNDKIDYAKMENEFAKNMKTPQQLWGLTDPMVEGIYAQAYRLYNTGKYKDAIQLFRLLVMLNPQESKFILGLGACFHLLKEYKNAAETYQLCALANPENPIPYYHSSDCYIQMKDPISAHIALEMAVKRAGEKPEYQTLKDRARLTLESLKKEITELGKSIATGKAAK